MAMVRVIIRLPNEHIIDELVDINPENYTERIQDAGPEMVAIKLDKNAGKGRMHDILVTTHISNLALITPLEEEE